MPNLELGWAQITQSRVQVVAIVVDLDVPEHLLSDLLSCCKFLVVIPAFLRSKVTLIRVSGVAGQDHTVGDVLGTKQTQPCRSAMLAGTLQAKHSASQPRIPLRCIQTTGLKLAAKKMGEPQGGGDIILWLLEKKPHT